MEDLHPTVRRYPRSLDEAFPGTQEYAEWFYKDEQSLSLGFYAMALVIVCMVIFFSLLVRNVCTP